ncbi:3582_t:CDS:2, partial [Acaulospora colombiana]
MKLQLKESTYKLFDLKGLKQFHVRKAILVREATHVHDPGVAVLTLIPLEVVLVLTVGAGRVLDLTHAAVRQLILEIFGAFGRIKNIELTLDEKCLDRQTNKGIAYIDFDTRSEAEKAISYMDGVSRDLDHPLAAEDHILTATHTAQGVDLDPPTQEAVAEVTLILGAVAE